ncbi:MAG TPA: sulfotransferase [Silvibacterium sp.]|nr:sulfotransferase [Silvibacterium sp.]
MPKASDLRAILATLDDRSEQRDAESDDESPIFLLATGWRTGSTLLQRILVTDPRVLLWGEPFGEMALLSALSEILTRLSTFPNLKRHFAGTALVSSPETSKRMVKSWIATLYPTGDSLRASLRALVDEWLKRPAVDRGFSRWGFKEVRLGATEATLLRWLYPNAKFVTLARDPFDCYRSLADSGWHHIYFRRPDIRVDSAAGFARHWNRLAVSWAELPQEFPVFHLKYEDLVARKVNFRDLESWLGVQIKEEMALAEEVGHTAARGRLTWVERFIIRREAKQGMRALGYSE